MARILADLPEEDIRWLDSRAAEQGKSRAAVLREAIATFKAQNEPAHGHGWIRRGAGIWKDRQDIGDAVAWQRRERAASARAWDYDYEDMRAEFPDLFDATRDLEHEYYRKIMGADSFAPRRTKTA